MRDQTLVNFLVPSSKRAEYVRACKFLGTSMSEVCRKALDQSVLLAEKLGVSSTSSTSSPPSSSFSHSNLASSKTPAPSTRKSCDPNGDELS